MKIRFLYENGKYFECKRIEKLEYQTPFAQVSIPTEKLPAFKFQFGYDFRLYSDDKIYIVPHNTLESIHVVLQ